MSELGPVLIVICEVATALFVGAAVYLGRSDQKIPKRIDKSYQVFICSLMTAVLINGIVQLIH